MDKQTPTNSLSSVRTFAKDMAKVRALTSPETTTNGAVPGKPVTKPEAKEESRIYQAPSWTGNKNKFDPKPKPEAKIEDTSLATPTLKKEEEIPEQILRPISALKSDGGKILVDKENSRPGIIITDSKKDRFRLFPAIIKSIKQWFAERREKQLAKKTPKYTVPPTSHRKGVIQKATSKTGKFVSADNLSIQERVRLRKERAVPKIPTTIWTANTEPGFPLLEAGENQISNVQVVLKKSFQNLPPVSLSKELLSVPKTPEVTHPKVDVVTFETLSELETTPEITPVAAPTPALRPIVVSSPIPRAPIVTKATPIELAVAKPEPEVVPTIVSEKITRLRPSSFKEWLFSINTNTISISVAGIVLALIIISGFGYIWLNNQAPTAALDITPTYQTLIDGPLQLIYPKTLTKAGLFEDVINSFKNTEGDVAQQIFVASVKGETLLKAETVMETLDFSLEPAFFKSVSYIYFGGLRKSVPFILLDISDYTTARGGMLNWETTIYEELAPLLNYNQLYDTGSIKTAVFTDAILDKNDVRILRTLAGVELLVYGLIDHDIVIITTNSTTFMEIANLLK